MLDFKDSAAAIEEPRTAWMAQHTNPSVKEQIQWATALLGVDESAFVISAALDRARSTIADHERTVLSAEDRALVLTAFDVPPEPTAALRETVALHRHRAHVTRSV